MLRNAEVIVGAYLTGELFGNLTPEGPFSLFATEGGTGAMVYLFQTLSANRLISQEVVVQRTQGPAERRAGSRRLTYDGSTLAFATAIAALALYFSCLRRAILTWGATSEESASSLPGDELLEAADGVSTRAIDIKAPATAVWAWLAQMGPSPRGGAYTYDWIENLLRLDMHSVDRVLPEFQNPHLGDTVAFGPNRMRLERVEHERALAWRSENGDWVWTFILMGDRCTTRLISRNRYRLPTLSRQLSMLVMEPGSLVMERKMLHGIRRRAERLASRSPESAGSVADAGVPT
jgi:hypothetical protein